MNLLIGILVLVTMMVIVNCGADAIATCFDLDYEDNELHPDQLAIQKYSRKLNQQQELLAVLKEDWKETESVDIKEQIADRIRQRYNKINRFEQLLEASRDAWGQDE